MKQGLLALADGTVFEGKAVSDVLFKTAMTGCQMGVQVNHILRWSKGQV